MATNGTNGALTGNQTSTWSNGPVKFQVEGWLVGKIRKDKATLVALLSNNVLELSVDLSSGERISLREFALWSETDKKRSETSTKVERQQAVKGVKRTSSHDEVPLGIATETLKPEQGTKGGKSAAPRGEAPPSITTGTLEPVKPPGPPKTEPPKAKKSRPISGKGTPVRESTLASIKETVEGDKSVEKNESEWTEVRGRKASKSPDRCLPKSADPGKGAAKSVDKESLAKFSAISVRLKRIGYEPRKDNDLDSILAELKIREPVLADKITKSSKVWIDYALSMSLPGYEESSILRANADVPPPISQETGGQGLRRSTEEEDNESKVKENPKETDSETQG